MPELPDVTVYAERIEALLGGSVLRGVEIRSPFLLRSVEPAPAALVGRALLGMTRLGKRLVFEFAEDHFLVLHLMIAGRLHWHPPGRTAGRPALCVLVFDRGSLSLTEAGTRKRASLHIVRGRGAVAALGRDGLEIHCATPGEFAARLRQENRTLKRALTDQSLFSGIGNAYSDEILHRARLSPVTLTSRLDDGEIERLRQSCLETLDAWTERLRREAGAGFPERVTAFRPEMAVHGRYGQPCPACGAPVQRIRFADHECNYCARCQCGGRLLADRGLSALLKNDWPRTLEELEERRQGRGGKR